MIIHKYQETNLENMLISANNLTISNNSFSFSSRSLKETYMKTDNIIYTQKNIFNKLKQLINFTYIYCKNLYSFLLLFITCVYSPQWSTIVVYLFFKYVIQSRLIDNNNFIYFGWFTFKKSFFMSQKFHRSLDCFTFCLFKKCNKT